MRIGEDWFKGCRRWTRPAVQPACAGPGSPPFAASAGLPLWILDPCRPDGPSQGAHRITRITAVLRRRDRGCLMIVYCAAERSRPRNGFRHAIGRITVERRDHSLEKGRSRLIGPRRKSDQLAAPGGRSRAAPSPGACSTPSSRTGVSPFEAISAPRGALNSFALAGWFGEGGPRRACRARSLLAARQPRRGSSHRCSRASSTDDWILVC